MTVKLNSLKANLKRERDGDWIADRELAGVRYKVRSLHAPDYRLARAELARRLSIQYRDQIPPPEVEDREAGRLYAKYILIDWEGFDQPLTEDLREEIFADPAWRDIQNRVLNAAIELGRPQAEFVEEAEKNSQTPSVTT